jgi:hypothetical protein
VPTLAMGATWALLCGGALAPESVFMPRAAAQNTTVDAQCGASSSAQLRTTLYFGLARPKGFGQRTRLADLPAR